MSKRRYERYLSTVTRNLREETDEEIKQHQNIETEEDYNRLAKVLRKEQEAAEAKRRERENQEWEYETQGAFGSGVDSVWPSDPADEPMPTIDPGTQETLDQNAAIIHQQQIGDLNAADDLQRAQDGGPSKPSYWDRAKSYATDNPYKTAGAAAAGAAGLGAAAYAMRRVLLKRRANNLLSRVERMTAECESLSGNARANCLRQVRAESSDEINEMMAQCEESDDPKVCRSEISEILNS